MEYWNDFDELEYDESEFHLQASVERTFEERLNEGFGLLGFHDEESTEYKDHKNYDGCWTYCGGLGYHLSEILHGNLSTTRGTHMSPHSDLHPFQY